MTTAREHAGHGRSDTRPEPGLARSTRVLLVAFVVLTLVATNQLFVLAPRTATLFSWTIQPPLSEARARGRAMPMLQGLAYAVEATAA